MRSTTFTRSITSVSIKSVSNLGTVVMVAMGSAVRGILNLTFLRDRTGYHPRIMEPNSKHWSTHEDSSCFDQPLNRLFKSLGVTHFVMPTVRVVPVTAQSAGMDLIGVERLRHVAAR